MQTTRRMYRGIATLAPMPFSHRCSVFTLTGGDVILTRDTAPQLVFGQHLNHVGRTFHEEETMGLVGSQRVNSSDFIRFQVVLQPALQDKCLPTMAFGGLFGVWIAKVCEALWEIAQL